jgi:hypothetical protein
MPTLPTGLGVVWIPRGRGLINQMLLFIWTTTAHESCLLRMGRSECLVVFCTDLIERYFCNTLSSSSDHIIYCAAN